MLLIGLPKDSTAVDWFEREADVSRAVRADGFLKTMINNQTPTDILDVRHPEAVAGPHSAPLPKSLSFAIFFHEENTTQERAAHTP